MLQRCRQGVFVALVWLTAGSAAPAAFTNNIMLTGYWPPSNEMIRSFSTNPIQNPGGWQGGDWESRGYDVYSFFPEFPSGQGQGVGDFEVDYQDTSADFWRVVADIRPLAIVTFGRGNADHSWEIEWRYRNLANWQDDYTDPKQPTPSPPDASVPAGYIRYSSLPMDEIAFAVIEASITEGIDVHPFVDRTGTAGKFLCEYIGYHAAWYHDLHSEPDDEAWNVAAGHIHVGGLVSVPDGTIATQVTLRELIRYVDTVVPEPNTVVLVVLALAAAGSSRRWR